MSPPPFTVPDVLVLAAGGVLGEAWMTALLAGIEDGADVDLRRTESFVGTSAGAIVAATLSTGRRPTRPALAKRRARTGPDQDPPGSAFAVAASAGTRDAPADAQAPRRTGAGWGHAARRGLLAVGAAAGEPLAPAALAVGAPGGALVRSLLLSSAPEGSRSLHSVVEQFAHAGARFDGRLRICCVDRASGRRVIFGAPGAPPAAVGEAVAASCAIPTVFRPVTIGGRQYVDGGVWSLTNLDACTAGHSTEVLCLSPTASLPVQSRTPYGVVRAALRTAEALETATLRRRGARVRVIAPDAQAAEAMGMNLMAASRRTRVAAAGYRQGLAIGRA